MPRRALWVGGTRARLSRSLMIAGTLLAPSLVLAHPLGNFSINQYAGLRITLEAVEIRYIVDMAEIPTFQEMQDAGIIPEVGHPSVKGYVPGKVEALKRELLLDVDGHRLPVMTESADIIFPPGAGGLPTMKLGARYRVSLPPLAAGAHTLHYRDTNFASRAGWKEIIAVAASGVTLSETSVPERDRSQELTDYPTDLLNSPPQDLEARIVFAGPSPAVARSTGPPSPIASNPPSAEQPAAVPRPPEWSLGLQPNRRGTPRSTFTDLVTTKQLGVGVVLAALVVATGLGALHALEPGHGKTVVAAYLVGSRGTAVHAVLLGLIVTMSHTGGVYLLGGVTLYASHYVVPERLYPWLGAGSGLAIAILGGVLFLRRYAEAVANPARAHAHHHGHDHDHDHAGHGHAAHEHEPGPAPTQGPHGHHHHHVPQGPVSLSSLVALGVTGGIVPCPAAVVVLLSALSLNRVGFGLILIVAFSVGLAAVLIIIGILMVYARGLMNRIHGEGPLIQRWLPLASSAVITLFGLGITMQALIAAGIVQIRF
jgi:ABC-type nickel/cobalt efflux system permease component RcnA